MRYLLPLILLSVLFARPASADTVSSADLVCDPARNIALVRFTPDGGDHYTKLAARIDHGLSALAGTGRRVCKLANGWEIRLRNGKEPEREFGMCAVAPPWFFSLWIDRHKVMSREIWWGGGCSPAAQELTAGVVITPTRLTICAWDDTDFERKKPPACTAKPLDLKQYQVDGVEYPDNLEYKPNLAKLTIIPGTDDRICRAIIRHGPNAKGQAPSIGDPDMPVSDKDVDWIDTDSLPPPFAADHSGPWASVSNLKYVFGLPDTIESLSFAPSAQDFDGDGKPDTVIKVAGESLYFHGSYYVVAPGSTSVIDMLRALYSDPNHRSAGDDVAADIKRAEALGWHAYSGGRPGLYPDQEVYETHLDQFSVDGNNYLLAYPHYKSTDEGTVIKPKPNGAFDTVCTIRRQKLNY